MHSLNRSLLKLPQLWAWALMPLFLAGCGNPPSSTTTPAVAVTTLQLSATTTSINSDNSNNTTITVTALSAANTAVSGVVVSLSADTGVITASGGTTVTTDSTGKATFTFASGTGNSSNRTATITANAGATSTIQIQIVGSTFALISTSGTSVPNDGTAPVSLTFMAKDATGKPIANAPVTSSWLTTTLGATLNITPTSGVTAADGTFIVAVTSVPQGNVGTATVSAVSGGGSASATISVTAVGGTFGISQTTVNPAGTVTANPTTIPMYTTDTTQVKVSAPTSTNVTFVTSSGTWVTGTTSLTVAVGNCGTGLACATLTSPPAGTTTVTVSDPSTPSNTDSMTVFVTAKTPNAITIQAAPTIIAKNTGTSTVLVTVTDASGAPVGNAPVAFSLTNTTGGGESVSPILVYTAAVSGNGLSLGQAAATFSAGSLSSTSSGVKIHAAVLGTTVATNLAPSGNDAAVVIGGTAGSIAFTIASTITSLNSTTYQEPMSVLVTDVNGNAINGAQVTLGVWPTAWSTGTLPCEPDYGGGALGPSSGVGDSTTTGTFINEDINGNLILDAGEDGYRKFVTDNSAFSGTVVTGGTMDGQMTPVNAAAGSLPPSVTTDATGVANFNLTYLKSSAIWTVVTVRASTVVQGTATVSQTTFRLPAAKVDVAPICYLATPYVF